MRNDRPQSEVYREAAMRWCDADAAARLLEDTKASVFAQRCMLVEGSVAKAEMVTRASPEWQSHLERIVRARTAANKARIEMEFTKMQAWERQSQEAYERQEMRMTAS